jgi:hypothetical protein
MLPLPPGPSKQIQSRNIGRDYPLPDIDFADSEAADTWRAAIAAETTVPVS